MEYYSISQLAKEFNVSRQAIDFLLKKTEYIKFVSLQKINGRKVKAISSQGFNKLKEHFNSSNVNQDNNKLLLKQITYLQQENQELHKELQDMQKALNQEQQLHLLDQQKIKTLTEPKQTISKKIDKQLTKHWWQFWK